MKRYLAIITVTLGVTFGTLAIDQVFTLTQSGWNPTNMISSGAKLTGLVIVNSSPTTNLTYSLIDCPDFVTLGNPFYGAGLSNGGYMASSSYLTNITRYTTNWPYLGTSVTGPYAITTNVITNAVYTYTNWYGGRTNAWRTVFSGTVSSNSTTTVTIPGDGYTFVYGIGATCNVNYVNIPMTFTYEPNR